MKIFNLVVSLTFTQKQLKLLIATSLERASPRFGIITKNELTNRMVFLTTKDTKSTKASCICEAFRVSSCLSWLRALNFLKRSSYVYRIRSVNGELQDSPAKAEPT